MSMRNTIWLCGLGLLLACGVVQAQEDRKVAAPPAKVGDFEEPMPQQPAQVSSKDGEFGTPATAEDIAAIEIDVQPGGLGLPDGSGTHAKGAEIFQAKCSFCHGADLQGIPALGAPRLIGGRGTLTDEKPVKTVESYWPQASTLFDYINRAMPMTQPGSLTSDEVYSLSAFILGEADIIDTEMTLDKDSFADIAMPNADGFYADPRPGTL